MLAELDLAWCWQRRERGNYMDQYIWILEEVGQAVSVIVDQTWEVDVMIMNGIEAESEIETEIVEEVEVMIVEGMYKNNFFYPQFIVK